MVEPNRLKFSQWWCLGKESVDDLLLHGFIEGCFIDSLCVRLQRAGFCGERASVHGFVLFGNRLSTLDQILQPQKQVFLSSLV